MYKIFLALVLGLVLVGCGTNSNTGLQNVALDKDLVVIDVDYPQVVDPAKSWIVEVTVKNRGGADARGFYVECTVHDGGALASHGQTLVETGLSATDVVIVSIEMSAISNNSGTTKVLNGSVFVDSETNVQETNENNNHAQLTISVPDDSSEGLRFFN